MAQAHIGHDCQVGSTNVFANCATLAGHVEIADHITIGAFSGVHQFVRVGSYAFVGGYSVVVKDPLPYARSVGNHARCYDVNTLGLRREGFSKETIRTLERAFFLLLASKLNTTQALERIRAEMSGIPEIDYLVDFIATSKRGVIKR
jgi:UDP-N-acetylglucosamine acyltransferase